MNSIKYKWQSLDKNIKCYLPNKVSLSTHISIAKCDKNKDKINKTR